MFPFLHSIRSACGQVCAQKRSQKSPVLHVLVCSSRRPLLLWSCCCDVMFLLCFCPVLFVCLFVLLAGSCFLCFALLLFFSLHVFLFFGLFLIVSRVVFLLFFRCFSSTHRSLTHFSLFAHDSNCSPVLLYSSQHFGFEGRTTRFPKRTLLRNGVRFLVENFFIFSL